MHTLSDVETLPILSAPLALAIARALVTSASAILGEGETRSARTAIGRVRSVGEELRTGYLEATATRPENVARLADTQEDRAVGTIFRRLEDYSILPAANPKQAEAAHLQGVLFPNGTGFLAAKFREEWTEVETIYDRIRKHDLAARLEALVGEDFTAHMRTTHATYGEALGITSAAPDGAIPTVQEPFARLREALSIYLQVVVVGARNGDIDVAHALTALEPVARMKAEAKARAASATAPEPVPVSPEPMPTV